MPNRMQQEQGALQELPQEQAEPMAPEGANEPMEAEGPQGSSGNDWADLGNAVNPNSAQDVKPEKKRQINMIQSMITDMIYNPATKESIQSMLKQAPPQVAIPETVNTVFLKFEDMIKQKKGPMPLDVKMAGGVHAFAEVMELAENMQVIPEDMESEQIQPLLKDTLQSYIQRGLKDGSIDPIELQGQIEPLLTEDEAEIGRAFGVAHNVPGELQQSQAQDQLSRKQQAPLKAKLAHAESQNKQMGQALQGVASRPEPQDQGQGGN